MRVVDAFLPVGCSCSVVIQPIPSASAGTSRVLLDAKRAASCSPLRVQQSIGAEDISIAQTTNNADDPKSKNDNNIIIRPLTQNWWPVSLTTALDESKPNPIELLNRKLVLWYNTGTERWSCLDDRCAHRFAPLSEGRVVSDASSGNSRLQCAYHGWEFGARGGCTKIPQASDDGQSISSKVLCSVQSYPIRDVANMIWVWADPSAVPNKDQDPKFFASNLLQRFDKIGGTARGFQRDLPYGMEYLGENLADVSHLPFSHHSVGALNREDGRPVPLEMLTKDGKIEAAKFQKNQIDKLPLYQVKVIDAAEHDPEIVAALKYNPAVQAAADPDKAYCTIGFFDPCHVRYHRNQGIEGASYEINLFMCPTTEGNSRVFLFSPFEKFISPQESKEGESTKKTATNKKNDKRYSEIMQRGSPMRTSGKKAAAFPPEMGHMIAHAIFDGDGIFLHKQGNRMKRSNLNFKDYTTPTSADILVNAFRRWLDKAAEVTEAAGEIQAANAATGGGDAYKLKRPRAELLDRYDSHTANCNICLTALKTLEDKRDRLSLISTGLVGATGASGAIMAGTTLFTLMATVLLKQSASRNIVLRAAMGALSCSGLSGIACWTGVKRITKQKAALEKNIQRFYFEDYVHSEKD